MKSNDSWKDRMPDIENLVREIADLKGVLQDISQQVRRIERRIDLILPERAQTKNRRNKAPANGKNYPVKTPMLSEVEARKIIERLTEDLRENQSVETVQSELRNLTVKHGLTPIARILGMTNKALPPKTELIMKIITRLRQSVMLTENIRKVSQVAEEKKNFGS